jgi:hypothetical protein
MAGRWKAWKTQSRFPTLPTVPWKSRQRREIPTFPPPGFAPDGKVENQTQVFHAGLATTIPIPLPSNPKPKKGSRPLRGLRILSFQDHPVLETGTGFRIILGLENA